MEEKKHPARKLEEYRQLTVRVEPEKLKRLKLCLIRNERTIQDWLMRVIDRELSEMEAA